MTGGPYGVFVNAACRQGCREPVVALATPLRRAALATHGRDHGSQTRFHDFFGLHAVPPAAIRMPSRLRSSHWILSIARSCTRRAQDRLTPMDVAACSSFSP